MSVKQDYYQHLVLLGMFVAAPMLLFFPRSISFRSTKRVVSDYVDYNLLYHDAITRYYNAEGEQHQQVIARHTFKRDGIMFFSKPQLFSKGDGDEGTYWQVVSSFAQASDKTIHFFGGVSILDAGKDPLSIAAHDFWYNPTDGEFFADSEVVYKKTHQVVRADSAHGNLHSRVVQFANTKGRIDTR